MPMTIGAVMSVANPERLLEFADYIEHLADDMFCMSKFNQDDECGTPQCMAGHAVFKYAPKAYDECVGDRRDFAGVAMEALQLDWEQGNNLFFPKGAIHLVDGRYVHSQIDWKFITKEQAAAVIRRLVETGIASWEGYERKIGEGLRP